MKRASPFSNSRGVENEGMEGDNLSSLSVITADSNRFDGMEDGGEAKNWEEWRGCISSSVGDGVSAANHSCVLH